MDPRNESETNDEVARATAVFLKHERLIRMLALSLSPLADLADDIVQEVFLELVTKAERWDLTDANKSRNLVAVVTRHVSSRLWTRRRKELPATLVKIADKLRERDDGNDELLAPENFQQLSACVDLLPEKLRTTIRRYYYRGRTSREIALEDGTTEDLVRRNLSRGRDKLRELVRLHTPPDEKLLENGDS